MVRKLKHHEQKLLKKHSFTTYASSDPTHRAATIIRRYTITRPGDYTAYNRLAGQCKKLAHMLSLLAPDSAVRIQYSNGLLEKLYSIGLLSLPPTSLSITAAGGKGDGTTGEGGTGAKLSDIPRQLSASRFARRRLAVVMTRLHMAENVTAATKLVEQGHVRVGTEVVTDPAFLVTRTTEDWVTWAKGSKVPGIIERWRGERDDFDDDAG